MASIYTPPPTPPSFPEEVPRRLLVVVVVGGGLPVASAAPRACLCLLVLLELDSLFPEARKCWSCNSCGIALRRVGLRGRGRGGEGEGTWGEG